MIQATLTIILKYGLIAIIRYPHHLLLPLPHLQIINFLPINYTSIYILNPLQTKFFPSVLMHVFYLY